MSVQATDDDQVDQMPAASVDALLDNLNGEQTTADESAADDLLMAGYMAAKGNDTALTELVGKKPAEDDGAVEQPAAQPDPDAVYRKEVQDRFSVLERSAASANGLAGHLKQQLAKLGQGKPITKESLKRVSEEFGEEFAEAFAADLNEAGLGAPSGLSDDKVSELVDAQVAARSEELERKFEFKLVRQAHRDAPEYFAGGKHNAAFVGWVQTLPAERQQEIGSSWDAETVSGFLDEFKTQRDKVATNAARQQSRVARAAAPTSGASATATQPLEDPLMAGWNKVKGINRPAARG